MMRQLIQSGSEEDIFSLALRHYGGSAGLADLLADNPDVIQGDGTLEQFRRQYLVGPATPALSEPEALAQQTARDTTPKGDDPFRSGQIQTIFDVALHQYGGLTCLALLLADNPELVKDDKTVRQFRQQHTIRPDAFANKRMKAAMLRLKPATEGFTAEEYWATENGDAWWTDDEQPWITDND
jgi:hypothetical protein